MSGEDPPAKRIRLEGDGLVEMTKEKLITEYKKQESYIASLLTKLDGSACLNDARSDLEERLKQQQTEASRKEKVLLMQLTRKEQELQEIATQLGEITKGNTPGASQLRSALLDPALNILFQRMRNQLDEKSKKLQQATDDMAAWKFTPDSQTGKRLMAKCRTLIQENQELGKQVSTGRTAQLEAELALQKKYSEELKASQDELNEFVIQLDEEVEGMQSTICALQQQLKEAKEELTAAVKNKQMEAPRTSEEQAHEEVHPQKAQSWPDERTSPVQQVQVPAWPQSEPASAQTSRSSSPKSPLLGLTAETRTPSQDPANIMTLEAPEVMNNHPRTAEEIETHPGAEEGGLGGERTSEGAPASFKEEEKKRTTGVTEGEGERTTGRPLEEGRTFSEDEMETGDSHQPGKEDTTVSSQDFGDSSHRECKGQREDRLWDSEQELQQRNQQQEEDVRRQRPENQQPERDRLQQDRELQQQEQPEEEMEIDPYRFENDSSSSSTVSEGFPLDSQPIQSVGELTNPVTSCEVSKTGDDSDEGFQTMTPDPVSTEPTNHDQVPDQTKTNDHDNVPHELPPGVKPSVQTAGNESEGAVDLSNGQGMKTSSSETNEVLQSTSADSPNFVVTSSRDDDDQISNSSDENQVTLGKAVLPADQTPNQMSPLTLTTQATATAKKLAHNCSLSVVDYDTGSSSDEDYLGDEHRNAEPSCPISFPRTNHSPTNPNLSPVQCSPASPANNIDKMGSEAPPAKIFPSGNGDSDAKFLTKQESRDSNFVEENGPRSFPNDNEITTSTD